MTERAATSTDARIAETSASALPADSQLGSPAESQLAQADSQVGSPAESQIDRSAAQPFDAQALFNQYKDSVVRIKNTASLGPNLMDNTLGTGFVIDREDTASGTICRVATDNHVIAGKPEPLKIETSPGNEYPFQIELVDEANDLVVLRVDSLADPASECKPIPLDSEKQPAKVDDQILKISRRNGDAHSVTNVVDSYFVRKQATGLRLLPGEDSERAMLFLQGPGQTGDSGGPGLSRIGKVVGIISAEGPGVSSLTPSHYLVEDLRKARQKGKGVSTDGR